MEKFTLILVRSFPSWFLVLLKVIIYSPESEYNAKDCIAAVDVSIQGLTGHRSNELFRIFSN